MRRNLLLLFGVLVSIVATRGDAWADRIMAPMKCRIDARGGLHVEPASVRMHRLVGHRQERTHRICANRNSRGPCRTLILHKFAVECTGGTADWNDIVARLIADRVAAARVRARRLAFRLDEASFASLNVLCDTGGRSPVRRSEAERHWQLDATCRDFGFVPRRWVELPAGFAPLSEVGGRVLVNGTETADAPPPAPNRKPWPNVMHVSAGINPAAAPDAGPVPRELRRDADRPTQTVRTPPQNDIVPPDRVGDEQASPVPAKSWRVAQSVIPDAPARGAADADQPIGAGAFANPKSSDPAAGAAAPATPATVSVAGASPPSTRDAAHNPIVAAAGVAPPAATTVDISPVTLNSWSTLVEVIKAGTGDGSSGEVRRTAQQSIITTLLSLTLLTSLVFSGIGLFAGRQLWSVPDIRKVDPYQVMLRREVADLTRPDAQMCSELCRSAQGLVEQINDGVTDLNGVAPLRRVLLREVRNMEKFLAATMNERPVDTSGWRRMRYRLQRVVTDLLRLKDITEGARRSLTTAVIAKDLPRDKYEAFEVLSANADTSEPILKRLVDALRATWHPDHAVNEDDRLVREDRIKQINVAWDLIQEKRVEA